jgi:hypothetical protein
VRVLWGQRYLMRALWRTRFVGRWFAKAIGEEAKSDASFLPQHAGITILIDALLRSCCPLSRTQPFPASINGRAPTYGVGAAVAPVDSNKASDKSALCWRAFWRCTGVGRSSFAEPAGRTSAPNPQGRTRGVVISQDRTRSHVCRVVPQAIDRTHPLQMSRARRLQREQAALSRKARAPCA